MRQINRGIPASICSFRPGGEKRFVLVWYRCGILSNDFCVREVRGILQKGIYRGVEVARIASRVKFYSFSRFSSNENFGKFTVPLKI